MIQHSDILEEAVKGTRKQSGKSFEVLYLLTYKQSYLDIRFSEFNQDNIRSILAKTYTMVWNEAATIPGGILLEAWIRERISEAYREVTGEEIEVFPDESCKKVKGSMEPMRTEILLKVEENAGIFNPDEDDEDDFRAGIRASAEEIDRRTGATRLGKVKAFISLFVAVILVVLATMVVMDLTDYVGSTERIKMGDIGKVIATAEAIEIETLAPPSEE